MTLHTLLRFKNLGKNGGNLWEVSQFHHRSRGTHQLGILVPAQRVPSDLHHGHDASRLALGSRPYRYATYDFSLNHPTSLGVHKLEPSLTRCFRERLDITTDIGMRIRGDLMAA